MTGPYHFETWSKSKRGADEPGGKETERSGVDGEASPSPCLLVSLSPCLLSAAVSARFRSRESAGSSKLDIAAPALLTRGSPHKPPVEPYESARCPGRNCRPSRDHSTNR